MRSSSIASARSAASRPRRSLPGASVFPRELGFLARAFATPLLLLLMLVPVPPSGLNGARQAGHPVGHKGLLGAGCRLAAIFCQLRCHGLSGVSSLDTPCKAPTRKLDRHPRPSA